MELTRGSETSANYNSTPGKYPKEHIQKYLSSFTCVSDAVTDVLFLQAEVQYVHVELSS
jgi:hypothetical protein